MESLITYHTNVIRQVKDDFFRFLYKRINWNQRMLAIKGPRGAGKTTLMLQYIKFGNDSEEDKTLYISTDHHWFYTHSLYETAEQFYMNGGRRLFLDEVHKYEGWSRELKNLYDGYPDLKIVFSASSALDIYRGEADLSRRVITYNLPGLSFREYIKLTEGIAFDPLTIDEIFHNHQNISETILDKIQPLPLFKNYLKHGYLPIITESEAAEIPMRLNQIINAIIESDLAYIEGFDAGIARRIKKLLGVIAESVPFKPNISSLARKMEASRESVYAWIKYLEEARLLNTLMQTGKGVTTLQKPDKIYLENTNLAYALREHPDMGSIRESFVLNQLKNTGMEVYLPVKGDFFVDDMVIEVGGKNKTAEQVKDFPKYRIASDDIETGFGNKIPIWLFGFLY
ncbi:MAG: AAA family ATPase [Gracilimonas sp.]